MTDENITWEDHIQTVEKKLLGLLYLPDYLLDNDSLKTTYFWYIHSYPNYANITWGSKYFIELKAMHYQQKHAARVIFKENILSHSRPLLRSLNVLHVTKFVSTPELHVWIWKQIVTKGIRW